MSNPTQHVWNPQTGITDIETPWQQLAASEIPSIRSMWVEQRESLKETQSLTTFTARLSREWAIETGIIENLYDIDRGVTQTLIERGFQAEFLTHGSTNKPTAYVLSLLRDQQDALEGVFDFVSHSRMATVASVVLWHRLFSCRRASFRSSSPETIGSSTSRLSSQPITVT